MRALALALLVLLAIGCESGGLEVETDTTDTGDEASSDTGEPADDTPGDDLGDAVNALGEECMSEEDCPTNPGHLCVFLNSGNPNVGYCSPVCASDLECAAGYEGPATSEVACFLPSGEPGCSLLCDADADCPGNLTCFITGGPVNVCTTRM